MRIDSGVAPSSIVKTPSNESFVPMGNEQHNQPLSQAFQEKGEGKPEQQISEEQVISAIEKANHQFQYYNTRLEFSIHEKTRQIMVKVYRDDQVIREIPPEKILDMVAQMLESAGLLVDETV